MKEKRRGNRERIIEAAIELMNDGGASVGTAQIATHLGISPGNLYYHFRNRDEIVREILARLRKELAETLALPEDGVVNARVLVGYYSNGATILWRYRFLVSSALELSQRDEVMRADYRAFTAETMEFIYQIIRKVVEYSPGKVSASPKECRNLAENMWVLWNGWPRHVEYYRAYEHVDQATFGHGLEQIAMSLAPYVDPAFHRRVKRGLRRFVRSLRQGR